jgi:hypothetical protein
MRKISNKTYSGLTEISNTLETLDGQISELNQGLQAIIDSYVATALTSSGESYESIFKKSAECHELLARAIPPITKDASEYFEGRSEQWKDGSKGGAHADWIEEWDELANIAEHHDSFVQLEVWIAKDEDSMVVNVSNNSMLQIELPKQNASGE